MFYCWLQVCSRGDLTWECLDTSVLMTSVYCCSCMMGGTHLPKKLVATALPLHCLYAQHQITCSSNSVQTRLLMDEVSISVTKQVRVRLLSYIWLVVLFVLEKIYFSVLDKWGRKAKTISRISQGQYLALISACLLVRVVTPVVAIGFTLHTSFCCVLWNYLLGKFNRQQ
jgi:hypothetical protein